MDRNEFYESMRKKIEGNLPESILAEGELVIKEARRNNDVMMHGDHDLKRRTRRISGHIYR